MSQPEHTLVGFDGSLDDVSVVVMSRRPDGTWAVENSDGPDGAAIARIVADAYSRAPEHKGLAQQVIDWLAKHADGDVSLSPWQEEFLTYIYESEPVLDMYAAQVARGQVHGFSEHAAALLQHLDAARANPGKG